MNTWAQNGHIADAVVYTAIDITDMFMLTYCKFWRELVEVLIA